MRRRGSALVVVALLAAGAAACSNDAPGEGEARLDVNGQATVERADGDRETVDGSTDLDSGDRVTMLKGVGLMQLRGGTTFELREGLDGAAPTQLLMGSPPRLEAGDLLVEAPKSTHVEADGTDVLVHDGAARLTRAFGMSASAYDADLELDSAGVAAEVAALRQVAVPDLGRPRPARPVDFEQSDPWDLRYLGAAMELDHELAVLARSFTGGLPDNEGRTPGFFKLLLPGLEDESDFTQALLDELDPLHERAQGDTLIGAAISDLGEHGSFTERWSKVFRFRDEGAAWGIVALDQAVQRGPLLGDVEQAFNTSVHDLEQAAPAAQPGGQEPGSTDTGAADDTGTTDGGTDGGTRGGDGSPTTPTTTPTTTPPPSIPPPSTPPVTPTPEPPAQLDPITDPVGNLVEDLLGGLLG